MSAEPLYCPFCGAEDFGCGCPLPLESGDDRAPRFCEYCGLDGDGCGCVYQRPLTTEQSGRGVASGPARRASAARSARAPLLPIARPCARLPRTHRPGPLPPRAPGPARPRAQGVWSADSPAPAHRAAEPARLSAHDPELDNPSLEGRGDRRVLGGSERRTHRVEFLFACRPGVRRRAVHESTIRPLVRLRKGVSDG